MIILYLSSMVKGNWEITTETNGKKLSPQEVIEILLTQRGLDMAIAKKKFFDPPSPFDISPSELGISDKNIKKVGKRVKQALKNKEEVYIYGDYDADGICATAIMWETLYRVGLNVLPYIPERFTEGYGIKFESVTRLLKDKPNLKLIITVDNGIVASEEIAKIQKEGVDVIVTDHHDKGKDKALAFATIHTTKICGAALSWIVAKEIAKGLKEPMKDFLTKELDLVAIGTIADQVLLLDYNRTFAKHGLAVLNKTKRPGLLSLVKDASLNLGTIGAYEVGYMIAPRLNAAGRLTHAIESLRLLCTSNIKKAKELSSLLNKTNLRRQKIVDEVVKDAKQKIKKIKDSKVIILASEKYHEGVVGLAAGKLTEEFYRPSIVISQGKEFSKGSARSISGFDIIMNIRKLGQLLVAKGGHPMAAGFTIKTKNLKTFIDKFAKIADKELTPKMLTKKHKADLELGFDSLSFQLLSELKKFEPFGLGNFPPLFFASDVEIMKIRLIGQGNKHLKLLLRQKQKVFEGIAFGKGECLKNLKEGQKVTIVYFPEENIWNGQSSLQIKIRDFVLT